MISPSSQKFEIKYGFDDLKERINFLRTSSDLEGILNKNSENFLGLNSIEFNTLSSWNFEFERNLDQGLLFTPSIQPNSWGRV
jgi:hypothetical protein